LLSSGAARDESRSPRGTAVRMSFVIGFTLR
jgi:hypothetical protein